MFVCSSGALCVTLIWCQRRLAEPVSKCISIPFTSGVYSEFSRVVIEVCFSVSYSSNLFSVTPLTSLLNAR